MLEPIHIASGKNVYFISDFHLGVPDHASSLAREKKIVRWLASIQDKAQAIFILGDIFDFWFEYRYTVPKGFIRLQGKLAELADAGIPIIFFSGNHDMWMFDYFTKELNIPIYREPQHCTIQGKEFLIGHGDGLGPGDYSYKFIKKIFANKFFQWLFSIVPPTIGMGIAQGWSKKSRISNTGSDEQFLGDDEWIFSYCKSIEQQKHHDFYVFGHRHLPLDMPVNTTARYINLGEWVNYFTYAVFDGNSMSIEKFEG